MRSINSATILASLQLQTEPLLLDYENQTEHFLDVSFVLWVLMVLELIHSAYHFSIKDLMDGVCAPFLLVIMLIIIVVCSPDIFRIISYFISSRSYTL